MVGIPNTSVPAAGAGLTLGLNGKMHPQLWHGQELDYVEFVADVSITATTEATANTIVTSTGIDYSGLPIWVEFYSPYVKHSNANGALILVLYVDGATDGFLGAWDFYAAAARFGVVTLRKRIIPTMGRHTYSIRAYVGANTGTVAGASGGSGKYNPGYLRISYA